MKKRATYQYIYTIS